MRVPFCLRARDESVATFAEAGFSKITAETRAERARFPATRSIVEADLRDWLPLFDIHLSEEVIARVLAASDDVLARYTSGSGLAEFDASAHIFTARKPD